MIILPNVENHTIVSSFVMTRAVKRERRSRPVVTVEPMLCSKSNAPVSVGLWPSIGSCRNGFDPENFFTLSISRKRRQVELWSVLNRRIGHHELSIICQTSRYRLITRFITSSAHLSTVNCHRWGEAYRACRWWVASLSWLTWVSRSCARLKHWKCENNTQIINVSSIGSVVEKFGWKTRSFLVEVVHFVKTLAERRVMYCATI